MDNFTFYTAAKLVFGNGTLASIGTLAKDKCGHNILVVTDAGIVDLGIADQVTNLLGKAGLSTKLFSDVRADPPEDVVIKAAKVAKDMQATGIIGLGGGSSLDVAKLVAVLATGNQNLDQIYGVNHVSGSRLPLILVPTTAGTGSEVTMVSIVTTGKSEKMGVVSPVLLPDVALLDPELTYGLPAHITAATGIDAMVHAIEAYASTSPNNNPLSKQLAIHALSLMMPAIETATLEGSDQAARKDMLLGSMLAGQAFANSPVAAVHALAYPIGGHFKVPHGLSNALVLPHVIRFNLQMTPEPYAALSRLLLPDAQGRADQIAATIFVDHLASLSERCGLQQRLRDVGIPQEALPMMAKDAMNQTRLLVNNPRPVDEAAALAIYQAAY